jgi:hypothetical protein
MGLDDLIEYAKGNPGAVGAAIGIGGALTGAFDGSQKAVGYQGNIPRYQASREQVPYAEDPNRRPGSGGRRYFSDTVYSQPLGATPMDQTGVPEGIQIPTFEQAQTATQEQAAAIAAGGIPQALGYSTQGYGYSGPSAQEINTAKQQEFTDFMAELMRQAGEEVPPPEQPATQQPTTQQPTTQQPTTQQPDDGLTFGGESSVMEGAQGQGDAQAESEAQAIATRISQQQAQAQAEAEAQAQAQAQAEAQAQAQAQAEAQAQAQIQAQQAAEQQRQIQAQQAAEQQRQIQAQQAADAEARQASIDAQILRDAEEFARRLATNPYAKNTLYTQAQLDGALARQQAGGAIGSATDRLAPMQSRAMGGLIELPAPMNYYAEGGLAELRNPNGYYLGGVTDGMADDVPASINGQEQAALSDGEFVIPADVVSHLGNGNSNAGAKELYDMMERIRAARTGNKEQGRQINPSRLMPN